MRGEIRLQVTALAWDLSHRCGRAAPERAARRYWLSPLRLASYIARSGDMIQLSRVLARDREEGDAS